MIKKTYLIFILTLVNVFVACQQINKKIDNQSINDFNEKIEEQTTLKSIINYFPNENLANYLSLSLSLPLNEKNRQRGFAVLICELEDHLKSNLNDYICIKNYEDDEKFIVNMNFRKDYQLDQTQNFYFTNEYPVPNFHIEDWQLGSTRIDTVINKKRYVYNKYVVPTDMKVYIMEACNGSFWKIESNDFRPSSLGEWKNGYTKGVAISESANKIIYYFIIW